MFKAIKCKTEQEWLELRSNILTATDVGVVLGLNPFNSVSKLIEEKKNHVPIDNSYTFIGTALEPVVVAVTNKVLNRKFKLFEDGEGKTLFVDEGLKLGATPDAYDDEFLLECKSTKPKNYLNWDGWPPAYYVMQLYIQLMCACKQEGYLSILSTNLTQHTPTLALPISIFSVKRSPKVDEYVIAEVNRFWECKKMCKQFKVNRKKCPELELRLRINTEKIH